MKINSYHIIVTLLFWFITSLGVAQSVPGSLIETFNSGKVTLTNDALAEKITLIIGGKQAALDPSNLKKQLATFFSNTSPQGFKILHQTMQKDSGFMIGKLTTSKGDYRIHCLFKISNNIALLTQLRIEEYDK